MEQKQDTRFWLNTFHEGQEQKKYTYKGFQHEIEKSGYLLVKTDTETIKIYTPELAVILTSQELPARNLDTKKETTVNGHEYFKTYIEAFKEGEQYFENEFNVSPNTLYGSNAEHYVKDIHYNFFHANHTRMIKGWGYVKKKYPLILTHNTVKEHGYYSGIVNKVEEQVKKYPKLYETFDKCEHDFHSQSIRFSIFEWATIFYYADETKLLTESRLIKTRLEQFMSKHQINTTFNNFKTKYYDAKKRINEKNDYPINKLELIIPFLEENYKQTVTKVRNDIIFLEENLPEH